MALNFTLRLALISALAALSTTVHSQDVRSLAMGGASVSSGNGVGGFVSNPALLLEAQRRKQEYHFGFGGSGEYRDNVDAVDLFEENENLLDDVNAEINTITAQNISCIPPTDPNAVCLSGTQTLGDLAGQTLSVFNQINDEPLDGQGGGSLGIAVTRTPIPFSVNLGTTVTGAGIATISDEDIAYVQNLNNALADNELTLAEINENSQIDIAVSGQTITVEVPDDILTSTLRSSYLLRTQLSIGLARSFAPAGHTIDVGISPKFSSLRASSALVDLHVLDNPDFDLADTLEANEVTASSATLDVGATTRLASNKKISIGGVIRNLVPESIKTEEGFEFETTPQLLGSAAYDGGRFRLSADLALNKARQDNYETQGLNLGGEVSFGFAHLRGGIQHDLAVRENPTDITLGLGLGFFDLGVVFSGSEIKGGGLQIAFSL